MNLFGRRRIYLDYASATPLRDEAKEAYDDAAKLIGNPGTIHADGVVAMSSLRESREKIAAELGCKAREIIFTGGLTEANNLAILGFARRLELSGKDLKDTHWITSSIEHPSVLECFTEIERRGGTITHIDPEPNGRITPEKLSHALRKNTVFVSIGWANSEIGIVQKLRALAAVIHEHEHAHKTTVIFHTDAGQAPLYLAPNVHTLDVDLFSIGSGKLYGPRGIGALYVGKRADVASVIIGGAQERGLRAGTEAPALAAAFAVALHEAGRERATVAERLTELRAMFAKKIAEEIPSAVVNGDVKHGLPHMLNISIPDINSEYLVLALDQAGISLSTKAACSEGGVNASHVVAALIGDVEKTNWRSKNTLRFSFGRETTVRDLDRAAHELVRILKDMPKG
ncbi:cysteine desulfurase [Candidatus Parcubacteria bacterium]|nr:MAG: cysteine desulfurase [Candidatus Parcubacteria bacterium]